MYRARLKTGPSYMNVRRKKLRSPACSRQKNAIFSLLIHGTWGPFLADSCICSMQDLEVIHTTPQSWINDHLQSWILFFVIFRVIRGVDFFCIFSVQDDGV